MTRLLYRLLEDVRGQSVVEFALALPFLVLISIGCFAVGIIVDRHLTLGQVVRNGGNMYARGIDFSLDQNKRFIMDAATGLDLQLASGRSAVYFSLLTRVPGDADCDDGFGGSQPCLNRGLVVLAERYMIGDIPDLSSSAVGDHMASRLAMPGNNFVDDDGNPASEGVVTKIVGSHHISYFNFAEAVATGAPASITDPANGIQTNEFVYAVEILHRPETISFESIFAPPLMYARVFF